MGSAGAVTVCRGSRVMEKRKGIERLSPAPLKQQREVVKRPQLTSSSTRASLLGNYVYNFPSGHNPSSIYKKGSIYQLSRRNGGSGHELPLRALPPMSWLEKPEDVATAAGQHSRQFGARCFRGVKLAFNRAAGVTRVTRACEPWAKNHREAVGVHYDPHNCKYQGTL
ncbi:hypothetical protein BHE74_00042366 [Ensete ventricosum]|nr:hypothetical protein BHE74_00042366 [Ensete ventricosum]